MGRAIVYLDVDGVLNTSSASSLAISRQQLRPELLAELKRVLVSVPSAAIVVSSSWRRVPSMVVLLETQLRQAGIPLPIGRTGQAPLPQHTGTDPKQRRLAAARAMAADRGGRPAVPSPVALARQRSAEIRESVSELQPAAWVAIDDLELSGGIDAGHFARTREEHGLTTEVADHAIALLMAQLSGVAGGGGAGSSSGMGGGGATDGSCKKGASGGGGGGGGGDGDGGGGDGGPVRLEPIRDDDGNDGADANDGAANGAAAGGKGSCAAYNTDHLSYHARFARRSIHWFHQETRCWLTAAEVECTGADADNSTDVSVSCEGWDDRTLRLVSSDGGDASRFWERTLEPVYHSREDDGVPMYSWFSGGLTNAAFNEVDR